MGNRTSRAFDYGTFARLIDEGPSYLSADQSVWPPAEKRCLKEFLSFLRDARLPWASTAQEAFTRVKLAVPKSKMAAEIHAYVENPIRRDLNAFRSLQPRAQIAWAHFYSLVMFIWSLYHGRPSALAFYESDLLYYVFQNDRDVDYEKVDLFIRALERIQVVGSIQTPQTLMKNRLLFAPFTLISGSIKNGSVTIRAEEEPRLIESGIYFMDGPVTISGSDFVPVGEVETNLSQIKKAVQRVRESIDESESVSAPEKCGHCLQQGVVGRHFLSRQKEDAWSEEEPILPSAHQSSDGEESAQEPSVMVRPETHNHDRCGPSDTRGYLDEILFRLDALCMFHKRLGFERAVRS